MPEALLAHVLLVCRSLRAPHGPTPTPAGLGGPPRHAPECQSARVRARADRPGYRAMPYFKTSTEWFEQSSLLLKARPASVRHNASPDAFNMT
jgi:hypothetical protein